MTASLILGAFALLVAAMVALDGWARWRGFRHLTAAGVVSFAMRTRAGRWSLLLGWWWLGWHLFARSSAG
jgi:hypothetical protein